jgi:hypothetical protein
MVLFVGVKASEPRRSDHFLNTLKLGGRPDVVAVAVIAGLHLPTITLVW